jgi:hypothetical protein
MAQGGTPLALARTPRWSTPLLISWYFKQGFFTLLTVPLLLCLVYGLAVSTLSAVAYGLALLRASYAIFGFLGLCIALAVGGIPLILPPVLYGSLVKHVPRVWLRPDASRCLKIVLSLTVLIVLPLGAYCIYQAVGCSIHWITARDPCAAYTAGLAGSTPPLHCP